MKSCIWKNCYRHYEHQWIFFSVDISQFGGRSTKTLRVYLSAGNIVPCSQSIEHNKKFGFVSWVNFYKNAIIVCSEPTGAIEILKLYFIFSLLDSIIFVTCHISYTTKFDLQLYCYWFITIRNYKCILAGIFITVNKRYFICLVSQIRNDKWTKCRLDSIDKTLYWQGCNAQYSVLLTFNISVTVCILHSIQRANVYTLLHNYVIN